MKINENKITLPLLNCWAAKYCPSLILRNARVIPQRKHVDPFNLEGHAGAAASKKELSKL
ncbi:hypothetical protein [Sphingobacterium faecium]|uniref:hypothetical protein n=1 Tax=Sphingobacterium faecium TaxID=34087 RepID=UPI0032095D5C